MLKKIMMLVACMVLFLTSMGRAADPDDPVVVLQTTDGDIYLRLFPSVAPKACENFLALTRKGYYKNTIFHRVIKGFMIQGGDPSGTGTGGLSIWGNGFEDELSPDRSFDKPGVLAMANSGPDTNNSQFFITTGPAPWLNLKHTIFGEVIAGEDVVRVIEYGDTGRGDRPLKPAKIMRAYVEGDMEADTAEDSGE